MSNYKIINDGVYLPLTQISTDVDKLLNDLELWLNEDFNFVLYWERLFNNKNFTFDTADYLQIKTWIKSESKSIILEDATIYIHAHVLLGFSITDPLVKIGLINNIYKLPKDILAEFMKDMYAIK